MDTVKNLSQLIPKKPRVYRTKDLVPSNILASEAEEYKKRMRFNMLYKMCSDVLDAFGDEFCVSVRFTTGAENRGFDKVETIELYAEITTGQA